MFVKRIVSDVESNVPEFDEGWWASILSDEGIIQSQQKDVFKGTLSPENIRVNWKRIQVVQQQDEIIELQAYGFNRGGLLVQGDSVQGFVPISHLVDMPVNVSEDERTRVLSTYVGRAVRVKVIECEPAQERVVFSERAALAGEGRRKDLFRSLHEGDIIRGTVTNITDFGVFVDLGGVEGLVHVSELSWGRVQNPNELVHIGQVVEAMVLNVKQESSRVALSLKRLESNPWDELSTTCKPGDVVDAIVTSIMKFGAFARLEQGVEGLIHVSSMNLPNGQRDISRFLQPGQTVKVQILNIDSERRRLGLGMAKTG